MIPFLLECFFLLLFALLSSFIMLGRRAKNFLACFIVVWAFFYDYIAYRLYVFLGYELISVKLFFEILLLVTMFFIAYRLKFNKSDFLILLLLSLVAFVGGMIGYLEGYSARAIYIDFRSLFLPLVVCLGLAIVNFYENLNLGLIVKCGLLILLFNGFVSAIDYLTFEGDYKSIWSYQSLLMSKRELYANYDDAQLVYQLVRDGQLRSSGFIVSPLNASFLYAFASIFLLWRLFSLKKKGLLLVLFATMLMLFFIYITQVRSGFLMFVFAILMLSFFNFVKDRNLKRVFVVLIPALAFCVMISYLLFGFGAGIDSSTLGRLSQYELFISEVKLLGHGLGSFTKMFDSMFIYTFLELGVLAVVIFYTMFKMLTLRKVLFFSSYSNLVNIYFSVFVFLASFQHVAGSAYYFLFIFYMMMLGRQVIMLEKNHFNLLLANISKSKLEV